MNSIPDHFLRKAIAAAASTLFLLPALSQAAEPGPIGEEFQVNTVTMNNQRLPAVAADADGDFVVAWQSDVGGFSYDIHAQRYNAAGQTQGAEFQVNTLTAWNQSHPAIAMDADGDFVVAWESGSFGTYEIRAQRYNAAGHPQGVEFLVNAVTEGSLFDPSIALDADGDFVVTWSSYVFRNSEIRAQRYNAAGQAQGAAFQVNTVTEGNQFSPVVALDADGDFVLAWTSNFEIHARRYNAAGQAQGAEFQVDTSTPANSNNPAIAVDAKGDFVVAWDSNVFGNYEIHAQRYNATGQAQGAEFQVNTQTANWQRFPAIALDADGDFVVAWQSGDYGDLEIRAQRYNTVGVAQGGEISVNTQTTGDQTDAAIALDADGDFVVAWYGFAGSGLEIRAQRYQGMDFVNMSLTQTDSADPAPVGSSLSYTLNVSNLHTPAFPTGILAIDSAIGVATGLQVVDTVPVGSSFLSASGRNWKCKQKTGTVTCDYQRLLSAAASANPITVTLTPPNSPGALIKSKGTVSANQFDDRPKNNADTETTRLQ